MENKNATSTTQADQTESDVSPLHPQPPSPSKNVLLAIFITIFVVTLLIAGTTYLLLSSRQNQQSVIQQNPLPINISPSPTQPPDSMANWRTYTNSEIGFSIRLPQSWKIKKTEKVDGVQTVWLYSNSLYKTSSTVKNFEIIIGSQFVYSTSGALCANQACEKEIPFEVNIDGRTYSTQVIKASFGTEKRFERYSFQIEQKGNLPYVTGTYFTKEEQKEIIQILSTFRFTQ